MKLPICASLCLLLGTGDTEATLQRKTMKRNGATVQSLVAKMKVTGEIADSVMAYKLPRLASAESDGGTYELYQDPFQNNDPDKVRAVKRDRDGAWNLEVELSEAGEPDQMDRLVFQVPVLAGGESKELRTSKFESKKLSALRHDALKKSDVEIQVQTGEIPSLRLDFQDPNNVIDSISVKDEDRSFASGVRYSSGTADGGWRTIVSAPKGKLPSHIIILIELEDSDEEIVLAGVKGSKKVAPYEDDELESHEITATVQTVECRTLKAIVKGDYALVSDLHLEVDGETIRRASMNIDREDGYIEYDMRYEWPWPKGTELVASVRHGAEWQDFEVEVKGTPIR